MAQRSLNLLLVVALAFTMSLADPAEGHDLPDGTPHLKGPLEVQDVLNRMAYIQHKSRLVELAEINGPYKQKRRRAYVAPTAAKVSESVEQWRPLVEQYFLPGDVPWAMRVMQCESGGDPDAANPRSSARGLFQHLGRYWPERSEKARWGGASIFDPEANIAVAAWLFYTGGPSHWVCR